MKKFVLVKKIDICNCGKEIFEEIRYFIIIVLWLKKKIGIVLIIGVIGC